MNRFAPLIRAASERLDLPQPAKSQVLLEMAADMEDLYEYHLMQGFSPEAAEEKVTEEFHLSDEALHWLIRVHASPYRRLMEGFSERTRALWERTLFIALTAFVAVLTTEITMKTQPFADASPLIWLVAVLGAAALIIAILRIYALYIKKDHNVRGLRKGLDALIGIGVLGLAVGHFTLLFELFRIAKVIIADGNGDRAFMGSVICVLRVAPVMNLALWVAIFAAVLWLILSGKVARILSAHASVLLAEGGA